jgi:hypothetical protein
MGTSAPGLARQDRHLLKKIVYGESSSLIVKDDELLKNKADISSPRISVVNFTTEKPSAQSNTEFISDPDGA